MSYPRPYIYLPKLSDQKKLIYALWDIGYRRGGGYANAGEVFIRWLMQGDDVAKDISQDPYMYLIPPGDYGAVNSEKRLSGFDRRPILTNSIPHFISYTRRHFPAQRPEGQ